MTFTIYIIVKHCCIEQNLIKFIVVFIVWANESALIPHGPTTLTPQCLLLLYSNHVDAPIMLSLDFSL